MYHYLITEKPSGKKRLIEASSPANAIAFCAKDSFSAQRCDGDLLELVKGSLTVEKVSDKVEEAKAPPKGSGDAKA